MKTKLILVAAAVLLCSCGEDEQKAKEVRLDKIISAASDAEYQKEIANRDRAKPTDLIDYHVAKTGLEERKRQAADAGVESDRIFSAEQKGKEQGRLVYKKIFAKIDSILGSK
jgi:hypothetical protein